MLRLNVLFVLCLGVLAACGSAEPDSLVATGFVEKRLVPLANTKEMRVSPTTLDFGNQTQNTSSSWPVHVSNTGNSILTVSAPTINPAGEYTISPKIGTTIGAGNTQDFIVTFTPTATGEKLASLVFNSDGDTGYRTATVALKGFGQTFAADVSPSSMNFGTQLVGASSTAQTVTVKNIGFGPLKITAVSIGAGEPFAVSPALPFTLGGGATLDLSVTFSPTTVGAATGTLSLTTDDAARPSMSVALSGTGAKPTISLSSSSLSFGGQRVGVASTAQTVTVSNTGGLPLTVSSVSIGAGEPFAVTPTSAFTLAAGGTKVLSVTFSPTAAGASAGTLSLATNDPSNSTAVVSLTGTGQKPTIALSVASLNFGTQRVGATSATQTVTVSNTGDLPLVVSSVSIGAGVPFAVTPSTGFTLAPTATKVLSVTFSPTAAGAVTGTLSLATDDPANATATVSLTGTGAKPTVSLSVSSLSFGTQRVGTPSAAQTVTVTNTGGLALNVSAVSIGAGEPFAVTPSGAFTLAPTATKVLSVTFSPTAAGAATGTLSLATDDPANATATVSLTGTGAKPTVSLSVSSLSFGTQRVGTPSAAQTVTVTNTGGLALNVSAVSIGAGEPFAVTPSGAFTLAPTATKVLSVTFSPTAAGAATGTLSLSTDDPARTTATVSLTGTGQKPTVSLSVASLNFGAQRVGTPSAAQTVTVSNTGTLPLVVSAVSVGAGEPFAVTPSGGFTLAPAATKVLSVTFGPTAAEAATGTLSLATDDPANATATVSLTGTGQKPTISLSVISLSFAAQRVGTPSAAQAVTVSNTGDLPLIVNAVSIGAGEPFAVTPSAGFTLAPAATKVLSVTFSPTAAGAATGTLTLFTDEPARPTATVSLAGTGAKPTVSLSPSSLSFTAQRVGSTSAAQAVTVSNTGDLPLVISAVSTGAGEPFAVSPSTGFTLAPSASQVLSVTFSPTVVGAATGTLSLATDDPARPTATVGLSGTGAKPTVSLSVATLTFGTQRVGTTSAAQTVTVSNAGGLPLNVSGVSIGTGEPFAVTPSATFTLAPSATKVLSVTFGPTGAGAATGTLSLTTDDPARTTATVSLSGTGQKPTISLSTSSLDFSTQRVGTTSAAQQVTVSNTGSLALTVSAVSIGAGEPFAVTPNTTFTLAANSSRVLAVTFTPAVAGAAAGTLSLTTDDPANPTATVSLTGTGQKPTISLSVSSLIFAVQRVGTTSTPQTVTVTNTGDLQLNVTAVSIGTGAPFAVTPNAAFTLAPNARQTLAVTYSPLSTGAATGTLSITSDDSARPTATVSLAGTGENPTISVARTVAFGERQVNTSGQQTLTVTNTGSGTLSISNIAKTGPGGAAYTFTPSNLDIPGLQSGTLTLTFAPQTEGPADATLTLTTNDVANPTVTVTLSGTGVKPSSSVPSSLAFGDVAVNGSSTLQLTVSNVGTGTLKITGIAKSGSGASFYTFAPNTLDVPGGQSANLAVTFNPNVEGQADANLILTTNDVAKPTVSVALSGWGGRPFAVLDRTVLSFGEVRVSATVKLKVRLTNTGRAPLVISQRPDATSPFTYAGPLTASIDPQKFMEFEVGFTPASSISYSGTLTINSNASNGQRVLSLEGTGAIPELRLDRSSIFFGDARVGSEGGPVRVTVSNTSNAEVILQNLPVQGPFAVTMVGPPLPRVVVGGSPVFFDVTFKPSVEGPVTNGSVTLVSDLNTTTALKVDLAGNGTVSKVKLSPTALVFGGQRVKNQSGVQPVVITNTGAAELRISQLIFSNPVFTITPPLSPTDLPLVIAAGEQRALSVVFTPTTLGPTAGKLFIISNAFAPADPLDLSGTGVDGQMTMTPSVVSFGSAEVGSGGVQQSVVLKNIGAYPLKIIKVNAPLENAFSVSGLPDGLVLQSNEVWPFTVAFTPLQRGYISTTAIIESDAVTNPLLNLAMSGTGVAAAVELQPKDINFGKSNVSVAITQDLSIKNVGEKDLSVSNITFADKVTGPVGGALDFSLDSTVVLPLVVGPGKSVLARLKFSPRAVGLREARAIVFTNDKAAEANLVGTGTSPQLSLSQPELDFGNVLVGNPASPKVLRFTNSGDGPLTLTTITVGGADASAYILSPLTLPITLQPGSFAEVSVSVHPNAERQFSAELSVLSTDASVPNVKVPMRAVGVRQQIQLSPTALDFGSQLRNNRSRPLTVSVTNSSASRVTLSSLTVEGAGASQFLVAQIPLPLILEAGNKVELNVAFTPTAEAEANGVLKIAFSELSAPLEVALRGQGIPTVISIKPAPLDFGTVRVGSAKRLQPITITNESSEPIVLASPEVKDQTGEPFLYDAASIQGRTIEPRSFIIVDVGYAPLVETLSEATLLLGTTSPPVPRAVTLGLKGRAIERLLSVDKDDLDFSWVDVGTPPEPFEVVVTNRSSQQQRVVVKLKDVAGTSFLIDGKALANPIPVDGSAAFTVAFQPQKSGKEANEVQVWLQGGTQPELVITTEGQGRTLKGQGGGCSSSTATASGSGLLALLALVATSVRRRRGETDGV